MPLDDRQAFRYGFLARCAEAGLAHDAALEKAAGWGEMMAQGPLLVGAGGLAAAAGVGALGGTALAHAQEGDLDPAEVKKRELIAAYNTFADRTNQPRPSGTAPAGRRRS
jgi:hypothetical protein